MNIWNIVYAAVSRRGVSVALKDSGLNPYRGIAFGVVL
jgi:hypothetical protein